MSTNKRPPDDASDDAIAELLTRSVSDGVVRVSSTGIIETANAAACALFGISEYPPPAGKIIGQTLLEATHIRRITELVVQAQQLNDICEAEVRLVGRTESVVLARAASIPESAGGGVLLVLNDQTEIQRLRTVRTEFVANVSHELRTPLASIRATAETLLDGAMHDPEFASRFLETIIREADRLVRLSDDLLELSRAESTRPKTRRFDLHALIVDVASRLTGQVERQKVTMILPKPEAVPIIIEADRSNLDQVFFNLIENAIKYTPAGGRVTVTLERLTGDRVAVKIEDTGIGILSQDLPRIFERFWRADRARKFKGSGGTGLGLSIVKHIVEAHGGVVTAESEHGQGSRFTVTLSLRPAKRDAESLPAESSVDAGAADAP